MSEDFIESLITEPDTKIYFSDGSVTTDKELIAASEFAELSLSYSGLREKNSAGSQSESGFIPEGTIGKTVGLSYKPEAE